MQRSGLAPGDRSENQALGGSSLAAGKERAGLCTPGSEILCPEVVAQTQSHIVHPGTPSK